MLFCVERPRRGTSESTSNQINFVGVHSSWKPKKSYNQCLLVQSKSIQLLMVLVFGKTLVGAYFTLLLKSAALVFIKHFIFPRQFYTDAGLQEKLLTLLRYLLQPFNILGDLDVDQSFNRSTKGRRLVRTGHQRYELFQAPPPPLAKILNSFFF